MNTRIRAGALLATLIVSLVAMCLCASILLLVYYFRMLHSNDSMEDRLDAELFSGISYILGTGSYQNAVKESYLDIGDSTQDTIHISQAGWGCFMYAMVEAKAPRKVLQKAILYGASFQPQEEACLYLTDHNEPLALVGNTRIGGDAYLPRAGIRQGYLEQRGYAGSQLVWGSIDTSTKSLPSLDNDFITFCSSVGQRCRDTASGFTPIPDEGVRTSFLDSLQIFRQKGDIRLGNMAISGKAMIISDSILEVSSSAQLENVILMAPVIIFHSGFKGNLQDFASDSIVVEQGCHLTYPSALVIAPGRDSLTMSNLTLYEGVTVDGVVMALSDQRHAYMPRVRISEGAAVNGWVYCNGYCYLQGQVTGTVFTDYFLYSKGPSVFDNMLVDATMEKADRSYMPGLFSPLGSANKNVILIWLQ